MYMYVHAIMMCVGRSQVTVWVTVSNPRQTIGVMLLMLCDNINNHIHYILLLVSLTNYDNKSTGIIVVMITCNYNYCLISSI